MIDKNKGIIVDFDVSVNKLLNIAYKKIEKSEYIGAIPILKKALAEDESNVDVMLELATIYSKMNLMDISNKYAYNALSHEHNEISLYLIGSNFFKLRRYDIGLIYFKRLLSMYPDGDYSDYVEAMIEKIEDKETTGRELKLLRLTNKGRNFIEHEQYKKAIRLFTRISNIVPEQTFIKNNLAMAYFYDGDHEKAIKICKEIMVMRRYDVHANCNLTLIYYKLKNKYELKQQKERLKKLFPTTQDEFIKLISTYCEMKCHEDVIKTVKMALVNFSVDIVYLFFMAVANYNLGNINKSLSLFHDILKIDEDNYIAYYYIKAINSIMKPKKIDYYNQLPLVAIIDCAKRIRALATMDKDELIDSWTYEDRLIVIWGTRYKDDGIRKMCFNILGMLANAESEQDLRDALFSTSMSDEMKKEVLALLGMMDAKQPYAAYFAGDILDVRVSVATIDNTNEMTRTQQVIDIFQNAMAEDFDDNLVKECVDMYVMILNKGLEKEFKSIGALCAVIEMSVREMYKLKYSKTDLYKRFHTTATTVQSYGNKLASMLLDITGKSITELTDGLPFGNTDNDDE